MLEQTGLRDDGVFAEVVEGPLRVVIFGAAEAAEHLCAYGRQLGWRTTVVDARPALATPRAHPERRTRSIKAWPDEVVDRIDERTAVVTLSHEERLDIPAVAAALERRARYIGAIGARRTQERRRAALGEQGFSEAELDRIHGPAGLDLGGRSPAQVALAIAAEIVAVTAATLAPAAASGDDRRLSRRAARPVLRRDGVSAGLPVRCVRPAAAARPRLTRRHRRGSARRCARARRPATPPEPRPGRGEPARRVVPGCAGRRAARLTLARDSSRRTRQAQAHQRAAARRGLAGDRAAVWPRRRAGRSRARGPSPGMLRADVAR